MKDLYSSVQDTTVIRQEVEIGRHSAIALQDTYYGQSM